MDDASTSHLVLANDALARPSAVWGPAKLAEAAPTILAWFYALRESASGLRTEDALLYESRTNFPRVAGVDGLDGAVAALPQTHRREVAERIVASAPLLRRLVYELTDTLPVTAVEAIWSDTIELLNACLKVELRADLEPGPYQPVEISDLAASNRPMAREAMEVVHQLHQAGFGGAKLWCMVHPGLGAWRNRLFAGPFPVRYPLPRGFRGHSLLDMGVVESFESLATMIAHDPDPAWRTSDPAYTSWFARTLERTAPLGVIDMLTAYHVGTTEGVEIDPPWWPLPTPQSCVGWLRS
jgi:hypothetical protein